MKLMHEIVLNNAPFALSIRTSIGIPVRPYSHVYFCQYLLIYLYKRGYLNRKQLLYTKNGVLRRVDYGPTTL